MSFRHLAQHTDNECGATVLTAIARSHGVSVTIAQVRELTHTDRHGATLMGLVHGAKALGFETAGLRAGVKHFGTLPTPFIAHVRNDRGEGHFVAITKVQGDRLWVSDPAEPNLQVFPAAAWAARHLGAVLTLKPTPELKTSLNPSIPLYDKLRVLWPLGAVAVVISALATVLQTGLAFFIQALLDTVVSGEDTTPLGLMAGGMALVLLSKSAMDVLRRHLLLVFGQRLDRDIQSRLYAHVLRLPMAYFAARQSGEIAARMSEARAISSALTGTVLSVVLDVLMMSLIWCGLWWQGGSLALIALAMVPFLVGPVVFFQPRLEKLQRQTSIHAAALQAHTVDYLQGLPVLKAYGAEERYKDRLRDAMDAQLLTTYQQDMTGAALQATHYLTLSFATLACMGFGAARVVEGTLSVGALMSCCMLLGYLSAPVVGLLQAQLPIQRALVAMERVADLASIATERDRSAGTLAPPPGAVDLTLEHVSFSYGLGKAVLDDVSLRVPAGHTVAIVGPSGSGKSTLCKLLTRFHDPVAGRILANGTDIGALDLKQWRDKVGFVDQECQLFSATLAENLRLGDETLTTLELEAALSAVGLDTVVAELADGLETRVGERGMTLSGGQRQRVSVARALLRNPGLLILDEATSHLDSLSEGAIQTALNAADRTTTTVVIAHRLGTVVHADRIVVMDQGRIVEQGTHAELLAQNRLYRRMWDEQGDTRTTPAVRPLPDLSIARAS
jgi:ABC-type bacteriocin/lantibiotic exporter with double-glycine peptidase domain